MHSNATDLIDEQPERCLLLEDDYGTDSLPLGLGEQFRKGMSGAKGSRLYIPILHLSLSDPCLPIQGA